MAASLRGIDLQVENRPIAMENSYRPEDERQAEALIAWRRQIQWHLGRRKRLQVPVSRLFGCCVPVAMSIDSDRRGIVR
jgi:hypothetical protein